MAHAQGVTAARVRWFQAEVPAADLYIIGGDGDDRDAVATIVGRGYDVLCPGGGDGTFMETAAALLRLAPTPPTTTMPALLPLRLGTGNAVHDVRGASRPPPRGRARDLARAADPRDEPTPLRLLEVDGRLTQFIGVGLDADWQADYDADDQAPRRQRAALAAGAGRARLPADRVRADHPALAPPAVRRRQADRARPGPPAR